ncbi:MAG: hypothetical protein ACOX4I_00190 [Anaerovoracaceae bacterium]|jgi:hypothetical protein
MKKGTKGLLIRAGIAIAAVILVSYINNSKAGRNYDVERIEMREFGDDDPGYTIKWQKS